KYFQADNLSVEQTEELLKIFANYVNAHKPNKFKNDQDFYALHPRHRQCSHTLSHVFYAR
ncbi:MAG: hypothetical protein ACFN39_14405, partial [Lacticaseibacillus rhamnosus]